MAPANLKTASFHFSIFRRPSLPLMKCILAMTAMTALVPPTALADQLIDSGSTITVGTTPWDITGETLTIGDSGTGTLEIQNGGTMISERSRLGNSATGTGTAICSISRSFIIKMAIHERQQ